MLAKIGSNGLETLDPEIRLKPGQIVIFKGYNLDGQEWAALEDNNKPEQKLVSLDPDDPRYSSTIPAGIKQYDDSRAIGFYHPPEGHRTKAGENELLDAINRADEQEKQITTEWEHRRQEKERLQKIGAQLMQKMKPVWAKAAIVAVFVEDESDSMTDYFATKEKSKVVLAWSKHTRNLFPEMRKAAKKYSETAHLAEENKEYEHRENYSMGHGTYLKAGHRYSSGWEIKKVPLYDLENAEICKALALDNHTLEQEQKQAEAKAETGEIYIEEYSDKALVVRGDTKPVKVTLKEIGGKFNPKLKGGPGWIFSKKKETDVKEALNL